MALSADKTRASRGILNKRVETFSIKTSQTLYIGSLAAFTTLGRVQAAAAATGLRPAGVVEAIINESGANISAATGNAGGTVKAQIAWGHEVYVDIKTAARTFVNLNKNVFISDDDAVTDTTGAGTAGVRVKIGSLTELNSAKSAGWLAVRIYGDADAT
jgi:hypothetical protein